MLTLFRKKLVKISFNGFTLLELIATITIVGIIFAIAIPIVLDHIEHAREEVCKTNRMILEKDYEIYLALEGNSHKEELFGRFLLSFDRRLCPIEGEITYVDGKVKCSVHEEEHKGDKDGGEVPYL